MSEVRNQEDARMLHALGRDPERTLAELYGRQKAGFMGFIKRYGGTSEDHLEVYHDAVMAFYDLTLDGKYDPSRAAISTLICAIGRNKLLTKLGKHRTIEEWTELTPQMDLPDEESDSINEDLLSRVKDAMEHLGEGCREIIQLFYYQRCRIDEIVRRLNYKNENVVKAHKSRCMKRLKDLVEN
jgi:RNA polymerase sigma factor (sigma-70 family)